MVLLMLSKRMGAFNECFWEAFACVALVALRGISGLGNTIGRLHECMGYLRGVAFKR
jgi:hypothetical protein